MSINFVYDRSACPLFADVHEHRFEQILNNLLSNAAKFSEPGSDVIISIASENSRVIVSVEDRGPGIPDEFRQDLYKPFTQADASTTRHYAGTGLGLAISKAMTEGMGGSIDFVSEVGVGTTFRSPFQLLNERCGSRFEIIKVDEKKSACGVTRTYDDCIFAVRILRLAAPKPMANAASNQRLRRK